MFIDIVAHGGNLLLNVGPTGDGVIPWAQAQRLLALGWWLRTNGEAIYGSRPWTRQTGTTTEGHGVRFTTVGDALYAIVLGTPTSAEIELDITPDAGAQVHLLGHDQSLAWQPTDDGLPGHAPGASRRGPRPHPEIL